MKVYQAIAAVMGDLAKTGVSKGQTNTFDNYKFRGIDDVYNALAPLLAKHGLVILPRVIERASEERTSQKGGAVFYITCKVEFDFVAAEDGSTHVVCAYGEAMDRGDKGTNKAMTAAYKYACFEAFCIPTQGADDADSESHTVLAKPAPFAATGGKITPMDGVWDALDPDEQAFIEAQAVTVREAFADGGAEVAAQLIYRDLQLTNDEILAMWSRLDSKIRNQSKKYKDQFTQQKAA